MDQQNFEPVKRRRGRPSKKDLAEREARQLAWENQQNAEMQHGLGAAPVLQQQPQHGIKPPQPFGSHFYDEANTSSPAKNLETISRLP